MTSPRTTTPRPAESRVSPLLRAACQCGTVGHPCFACVRWRLVFDHVRARSRARQEAAR
jgi:hypothetical protein